MEDGYTLSSPLFEDMWSQKKMRDVFSDRNLVKSWCRVEVALAKAQALNGLIPEEAASAIEETGRSHTFDLALMRDQIVETLHELVPFLNQFCEACPDSTGQYVHWGATTQDIIDTAMMLRAKEAMSLILSGLVELDIAMVKLCEQEAETVMAGRTHGQQALPITFGFKVASWLSELRRGIERLEAMSNRVFCTSVGGAVGTSAYMGPKGINVSQRVATELELNWDEVSWHAARDRIGEMLSNLIIVGSSLGRVAQELATLQKTELYEVHEPQGEGQVGSSTMPQKRNPSISEGVFASSLMLRAQANLAMELMATVHERDDSRWQIDSRLIPEVFLLLDGQIGNLTYILQNLEVDRGRMRANIVDEMAGEPIMKALAECIGRHNAHRIVHECFMTAYEEHRSFLDVLIDNKDVMAHLSEQQLRSLVDPSFYLGTAASVAHNEASRKR